MISRLKITHLTNDEVMEQSETTLLEQATIFSMSSSDYQKDGHTIIARDFWYWMKLSGFDYTIARHPWSAMALISFKHPHEALMFKMRWC